MHYGPIQKGQFLRRLNRFSAWVRIDGTEELCHVKNTGRLGELLLPEAVVYLEHSNKSERKTRWDLIAVESGGQIVNIDSQAPNRVFGAFAASGAFRPDLEYIRPEFTYGDSRFDFRLECHGAVQFVEVKGVTLLRDGRALFPDAPTERGIRHIHELMAAREEGYQAYLLFVVQARGLEYVAPNDPGGTEFGDALRLGAAHGVVPLAYDCTVAPQGMWLHEPLPVCLIERDLNLEGGCEH